MTTTKTNKTAFSAVQEAPAHPPEYAEHLDELPHGVVVPDDLSGLQLPESTPSTRRAQAVRWLRWVAAFALLAVGVVIASVVLYGSDETQTLDADYTDAHVLIQESLDAVRAERQLAVEGYTDAQVLIQESIDAALAERAATATDFTKAQVMIQESIDAALAERVADAQVVQGSLDAARAERGQVTMGSDFTKAQVMIQESIDAALAERVADAQVVQGSLDAARAERGR